MTDLYVYVYIEKVWYTLQLNEILLLLSLGGHYHYIYKRFRSIYFDYEKRRLYIFGNSIQLGDYL